MGVKIQVPWRAFHRAACSFNENGRPLPINEEIFCREFNVINIENGPNADFMIDFMTEQAAMMFLLKWS